MTASACGFSLMAIFVKRLARELPQLELVFFRSAINLVWVAGLVLALRESLRPPGKRLLVFRGVAGFAGVCCLFYSISHLPLPIATLLSWCSPIFVILFSRVFLGERLPGSAGFFVPVAFVGLVLLIHPTSDSLLQMGAALIGLLGAAFGGMAYVAVRAATARVGGNVIVFYFVLVSTLISAPLAVPGFVKPTWEQSLELLALGTFATVGQLTMTQAYRYASAGVVSMMNLLNPIFGAAIGLLVFDERLIWFQWMGMVMVGSAVVGLASSKI